MKINTLKLLFTVPLAALLCSCLGTQSYKNTNYPPVPVERVEVVDLHQIQHKYEIIGSVTCNTEFGSANYLRKEAAAIGADAISIPIHVQADVIEAQAIKYKD
jgi:hypothetical protein